MPHISEMIPSKYLKKEDVGQGVLATVKIVTRTNIAQEGRPAEYHWLMYFEELEKPLILKATNIQLCAAIFQDENSDNWPGKKIVLYNDATVMMRGEVVGGIRVRAPRIRSAPTAPSAAVPIPERPTTTAPVQHYDERNPPPDFDDDIPF